MSMYESPPPGPAPGRTGAVASLLRLLLGAGGFVALLAAVAALVIYPLWYLATQATALYSAGFLGLLSALAVLFFILRWRRAARNARLDVFFLKVARVAVFTLFLLSQAFLALFHVGLFGYVSGGLPFGLPTVLLYVIGCLTALVSLALPDGARRHGLLGPARFVVATVLFAAQGAYWAGVFVVQQAFPYVGLVILTILGFFFFKKVTKIKRERKSPRDNVLDS
ncbi:MAG: hypothetical protein JXD23_08465 [Spirochaetales bacterium]|nr:hypothetical protein [Spirochaetales bacterium]